MLRKDFLWGAASAATQIEGAAKSDGKSLTVWDVMSDDGGFIFNGHRADDADDSYNRMDEDVALLKELGVNSYRFSVSWARVIKDGDGEINQKGLDHYSAFVDKLLEAGIEPMVTLFHWDLPYAIYKKGGWLNRECITKAFAKYVEAVAEKLAGRVKYYITFNEPQCIIGGRLGGTVRGAEYSVKDKNTMIHNLLLCHGEAVKVLRRYDGVKIGYAPCNDAKIPLTNSPEDIKAARLAYFDYHRGEDGGVALYSDPIVLGDYPAKYYAENRKDDLPEILDGDMALISQKIDFYCQNIYFGRFVKSDGNGGYVHVEPDQNTVYTCMDWPVTPTALYWGAKFLYERYKLPFVISENGCATTDIITKNGEIHDGGRQEFLRQYIENYLKAGEEGVDIMGYFVWSLLDNLEWYCGYSKRFGLTYVDYNTYKRTPKDSFYTYKNIIKGKFD